MTYGSHQSGSHQSAGDIAAALARNAEAVCCHYLANGRREGRYWLVGDIQNAPGRSLFVRLVASPDGNGAAGKWTDAATGDHGDLLDVIASVCRHASLGQTLTEARHFLSLPLPAPGSDIQGKRRAKPPVGTPEAARKLWSVTRPIGTTLAEYYLASRGITDLSGCEALRFHPRCYYRRSSDDQGELPDAFAAVVAAVTDLAGSITGVHRTWLAPDASGKADVAYPRRAMGHLLGSGVRFGRAGQLLLAGEGIETVLSLRQIMPGMPMLVALSAAHLAAILFPAGLKRLYVARDDDAAGSGAVKTLMQRALPLGIDVIRLDPMLDDFNDDLTALGRGAMARSLRPQLLAADAARFLKDR